MWERLRRFSALERRARGLFLRAAVLLPLISLSLRLRGFRETQAFLRKFLSTSNNEADSFVPSRVELTVRMVRAATRHGVGRPTCLEESLALWWFLGRARRRSFERAGIAARSLRGV
jgi:hypothetical protein